MKVKYCKNTFFCDYCIFNLEDRKDAMIRIMTKGPSFNDSWLSAGQLAMLVFGNGGFSSRLSKIHEKFNQYNLIYHP